MALGISVAVTIAVLTAAAMVKVIVSYHQRQVLQQISIDREGDSEEQLSHWSEW